MVQIATRKSWGARYPDGNLTLRGLAAEVFLHHSVTAQLPASATVAQERAQMRVIEQIGYSRFGRYGIGISYNVVIFPSGRAYQGVSWNRRGAHTDGRNSTTRSICFAGNYDTARPTAAQLETAAAIVAHGRGRWWTKTAPIRGHRDIKATACPGRYVYAQRSTIANRAAQLVSNPGSGGGSVPTVPDLTPLPGLEELIRMELSDRVPVKNTILARYVDADEVSVQWILRYAAAAFFEAQAAPLGVLGYRGKNQDERDLWSRVRTTERAALEANAAVEALANAVAGRTGGNPAEILEAAREGARRGAEEAISEGIEVTLEARPRVHVTDDDL